ncbi:hypothetical protein KR032_009651 [Drosophila birchii]|nr:hypothetical protein KR032_009651 [Drosophila birchii]
MCLKGFCGYFSLYIGCVIIGVAGVIAGVMVFSITLFELLKDSEHLLVQILALVFALVYCLGRIFLLFGTMWDRCWAIILAFIIGIISFLLLIATVFFFCTLMVVPVYWLIGSILIIRRSSVHAYRDIYIYMVIYPLVEVYYLWLIISTWWCCRACTRDC